MVRNRNTSTNGGQQTRDFDPSSILTMFPRSWYKMFSKYIFQARYKWANRAPKITSLSPSSRQADIFNSKAPTRGTDPRARGHLNNNSSKLCSSLPSSRPSNSRGPTCLGPTRAALMPAPICPRGFNRAHPSNKVRYVDLFVG
jgi:hypothetical protein